MSENGNKQPRRQRPPPPWWYIFFSEYVTNGNNARKAYMTAKPNVEENTADTESYKLLRRPEFQDFLKLQNEVALTKAEKWQQEQLQRSYRIRGDIDATRDQFPDAPNGSKMIDTEALVDITKTEHLNDQIARRSLNLDKEQPQVAVQINVINALEASREKLEVITKSRKALPDARKVMEMEVE